jgi:hypothetical protein
MSLIQWTERHENAAKLVAEGELSNVAICARVGISSSTLNVWKKRPEFAARVDELVEAFRIAVRRRGIAILERRVDALHDRWARMQRIIEERAQSAEMIGVPGGTTGLVMKVTRAAASENTDATVDYVVDTALLKELREHEKQAAQELGQWVEKKKVDQFTKAYITVGPDDL